ncbi:transmembrane protein 145-like isoform X3 [Lineus longissimus]|uniref:transmembrane protein 145-like isoform X3 n=1 Tax=Lineus longissimus TaxID=88925 RepID=UPI00315C81CE
MDLPNVLHVLVAFLLCLLQIANGKFIKGTLQTTENWVFLTRFCFLSEVGEISFKLDYPEKYAVQSILLYYDEEAQWAAVYKNKSKDCKAKEAVLSRDNNQIMPLFPYGDPKYYWSLFDTYQGCHVKVNQDGPHNKTELHCKMKLTFKSSRERWWFIAIDNCNSTRGLYLNYEITMTNSQNKNLFFYHFSADEFYILQVDIAFLLAELLVFALSCYMANILVKRQLFHTTYKMYMAALGFEVLHLLVMVCAYGAYGNDGIERRGVLYFGRIFESISILIFLLMLILMAKGYTITRGRLSQSGAIKIAVFMTAFVIVYAILFIYEAFFFDPGFVLYTYESVPGYGLIGLRLVGWIWFCYAIFFTLKHYPEKGPFYYPFFVFYTLWWFTWPIVALVAMRTLEAHYRQKVVNAITGLTALCGHVFLLILTRPAAANTNFPYHVRTSQIGVLDAPPTQNGTGLSALPYSGESSGPNFTDLFVVTGEKRPEPVNLERSGQPSGYGYSNRHQDFSASVGSGGLPVDVDSFPHHKPGEHTLDHFITVPSMENSS